MYLVVGDRNLHVLAIVHSPTFQGPHNTTSTVAKLLEPEGIHTTMLLPDDGPDAAARIRAMGVDVVTMPLHRARARPDPRLQAEYFGSLRREVRAIADLVEQRRIDVVDTNTLPNLHGGLAARKAGVACVWEIIDTFPPPAMRRAYMPFVLGLADVVMTTGVEVAAGHPGVQQLGDRWVTYFPCVDVARFTPDPDTRAAARAELGLPADATVIGNVAVMTPMKGHRYFIRAAAELLRTHPDTKFVILGSRVEDRAGYYAELFAEAASLGLVLGENLVNVDPGTRVADLAQAFDVFWMTSEPQSEGAPTVIGEAKALGLPVVTTDVGSCSECVTDGVSGFVVPARDTVAIAERTRRILVDPALSASMSTVAREEAFRDYDSPNGAEAHRIAFERAVAHRASRPRRWHEPRRPRPERPYDAARDASRDR